MNIAIAVKTIDRRPRGSRNYLGETLSNLARSGVFESEYLHSLTLVDGGSEDVHNYFASENLGTVLEPGTWAYDRDDRNYHQNACRALELAGKAGADWAMVIEDDIDVCSDFLESVAAWLDDHAVSGPQMYVFGANYRAILQAYERGESVWRYPCPSFYGALCCVWRPRDAMDIVDWYGDDPAYVGEDGERVYDSGHDLMLARWGPERHGLDHYLASAPCFIQHIGLESGLGNRKIQYASFLGREWSYLHRHLEVV